MNVNSLTLPSPAKLNLFLHIVGRRENGYHELETVFQFLDFGDELTFTLTHNNEITLATPFANVASEDNLIVKAAKALLPYKQNELGVDIAIDKVLPMGGGLGGGSTNAATTLLALNQLWQLDLSLKKLAEIGLKLGADVPIFVHGFAAFAQGVGEVLTPVEPTEYFYLVSKPDVSISTQAVFTDPDLVRDTAKINPDQMVIENFHNDCQNLVIKRYPEVAKLLAWLVEYAPSQMTGTGACIFSRFDSREQAEKVQELLPENITSFVAKGVNQSPLHQALAK